jgi:MoaA/NifB/PqqE/SkfB family radical SAM enzyme/glycosyltransferase involved in cell wall biosynthesis
MLKKLIAENLYNWEKNTFAPPIQISITPTNFCNLKCHSCWQRDEAYQSNTHNKPAEIPEQKLCQIVREASELGVRCVELTGGGEPLARKSVTMQLIKEIKNRSMIGWMTSNGTLFTPDIVQLMIEMEWDKLTISLDGPDAKTNDFLRPPAGSFEKVINTLVLFNEYKKSLNKNYPEITFNVVVSKYNIDKLSEMIFLAGKYAVKGVTFEPIKILSDECKELSVDFEKEYGTIMKELEKAQEGSLKNNIFTNIDGLKRIPELIKYSGKLLRGMPEKTLSDGESKLLDIPCIEPWFHIYLEADGSVRPCCVNVGLGENAYNRSLKNIWFGENFSSFRNAIISKNYPLSCNQCNANLICFSREIQELLKEKLSVAKQPIHIKQLEASQKQKQIKMLITDTAPLYPPLWGGPKRIWHLYSNLSPDLFDITYIGVNFGTEKDLKYRFTKISDNFKEILCTFPPHYYFWHIFEKAIFRDDSFDLFLYLWMHTDWQFKYILNAQGADIVVCSHPWSSLCINKNSKQFFIYDAHNCEYLLMNKILGNHYLKSFVLRRVRKIESDACRKSDIIFACSNKEKNDFTELYKINPDKIIIINNGSGMKEKTSLTEKDECRRKLNILSRDKVIIFIGAYYKPNIQALKLIIENIAPALKEFKFLIVGKVCDSLNHKILPQNIILLGTVLDAQLDFALKASDVAINPMFDGSGVNIKMLDYMSYGLPIVTTECGARGIETFGRQPMIVSSFENFVDNIKIIITDTALYKQMSEEGRNLVAEHYDWKKISTKLQNILLKRLK